MLYPTLNEFLVQGSRNTPFLKEKTTVKIVKVTVKIVKISFFCKIIEGRIYLSHSCIQEIIIFPMNKKTHLLYQDSQTIVCADSHK
jgi:hypothetical protein